MRTPVLPYLLAMLLFAAAGCEVKYTAPATQPARLSPAERDFEAVWQAARQTLRRCHFELDRQDRRAGVITTAPLTGMHFFEFWRGDAVRPADFGESTVQTIYRAAKVTIRPAETGADTYEAQVEVFLRRSNRPGPQVTSTSEAYSLVNVRGGRRREGQPPRETDQRGADAVDLGHDRSLEAKLTAEIAAAADELRGVRKPQKQAENAKQGKKENQEKKEDKKKETKKAEKG